MSLITRGAPALILPSRYRLASPTGPLEINSSSPLAQGLAFGSFGHSLIGAPRLDQRTASRVSSGGVFGLAHNRVSGANGYLAASGFQRQTLTRATIVWIGLFGANNTTTTNGLASVGASSNNQAFFLGISGGTASDSRRIGLGAGSSTSQAWFNSAQVPVGSLLSLAGVYNGDAPGSARLALYSSGASLSLNAATDASASLAGVDLGFVGAVSYPGVVGDPATSNTTLEGTTHLCAVWLGRALSADEVADIHANPWQLVRRRQNRLISIARAATAQTPGVAVSGAVIESQGDASGALAVGSVIAAGAIVEDQGSASGAAVVEIRSGGDFLEPLPPFEDSSGESYAGGKLKIMAPIPILGIGEPGAESAPAYLVSSNAREETEPVYSTETIYGIGDVAVFGSAVYQSLANANAGNNPAQRPTKWARVRPTYSAGAFDLSLSTVSVAAGELDMLITTNGRPDTLCLHAVVGDQAQVEVIRGATTIYREVRDLWREELAGSSERLPDNRAFFNLLCEPGDQVRVTVRRGGLADASVRAVTLGNAEVLGNLVSKPSVGTINRDKVSFDTFGELQVQAAGFQETVDGEIEVDSGRLDRVVALSRRYRSTPVVVIGVDNLFRCLLVYGVLREIKADPTQDPITSVRFGVTGLAAT